MSCLYPSHPGHESGIMCNRCMQYPSHMEVGLTFVGSKPNIREMLYATCYTN